MKKEKEAEAVSLLNRLWALNNEDNEESKVKMIAQRISDGPEHPVCEYSEYRLVLDDLVMFLQTSNPYLFETIFNEEEATFEWERFLYDCDVVRWYRDLTRNKKRQFVAWLDKGKSNGM